DSSNPVVAGLTNASLSNWSNSVHEYFTGYPSTWQQVATWTGNGPYILVNNGTLLFYGPALASGVTALPNEQTVAEAAGYSVVVKDAVAWSAMTTADFQKYAAIVFPDPTCVGSPSPT